MSQATRPMLKAASFLVMVSLRTPRAVEVLPVRTWMMEDTERQGKGVGGGGVRESGVD